MGYDAVVAANKCRTKHGKWKTRTYRAWQHMKDRCHNPKNSRFHRYGGRGITVCDRWQEFDTFYADMGDAPDGASLNRIDNDGNYEPVNCMWSPTKEQQNNISTNSLVEWEGRTQTLAQWAYELGIPYKRIVYRHSKGWVPPDLFTRENRKGKTAVHRVEYNGEMLTLKEASDRSGVPMQTLYWRMRVGKALF